MHSIDGCGQEQNHHQSYRFPEYFAAGARNITRVELFFLAGIALGTDLSGTFNNCSSRMFQNSEIKSGRLTQR